MSLASEIYMTGWKDDWIGNIPEIVNTFDIYNSYGEVISQKCGFFPLRCDTAAHPRMQELANSLKKLFDEKYKCL
jgi:hypothetical protein